MNSRLIKILFACAVGIYMALVCLNNVMDYPSNFTFVSRVSTMGDTFSLERNGWRSVHSVFLHHVFFVVIILWEAIVALCLVVGLYPQPVLTTIGNLIQDLRFINLYD